jgi:hypothetical protein
MTEKSWKLIECEAWIATWLAEHPLPPMSKRARWRVAHAAWLEMRRLERRAERLLLARARDSGDASH